MTSTAASTKSTKRSPPASLNASSVIRDDASIDDIQTLIHELVLTRIPAPLVK